MRNVYIASLPKAFQISKPFKTELSVTIVTKAL